MSKRRRAERAERRTGKRPGAEQGGPSGETRGVAGALWDANGWQWSLGLLLVIGVAFSGVTGNGFLKWDDPYYVTENPRVLGGLTGDGIRWALTARDGANWHPLTWFSHMLDVQLFGVQPGMHHLMNVVLHALSALLVFGILRSTTAATVESALVAGLFAVHPLRVESVAWAAERKDVLSTFWFLLTIACYVWYTRGERRAAYLAALGCFALALMSKAMVVTLPFALLLLDVWPLRRLTANTWPLRVREKIPMFALALVVSVVTFVVQRGAGAVQQLGVISLSVRFQNAVVAYAEYLGKTIAPVRLSALYPFTSPIPAWKVLGALVLLTGVSVAMWRAFRSRPYLTIGWLWFVGTLVPVIGIVQVGYQAYADRYTYIPSIGIFVLIVWGVRDAGRALRIPGVALASAGAVALAGCVALTRAQVRHWADGVALWSHTVAVTGPNLLAENSLGVELADRGQFAEAIPHYTESLRLSPGYWPARLNLAIALASGREFEKAVAEYREILRTQPSSTVVRSHLAQALGNAGDESGALAEYDEALRLSPDLVLAHVGLANLLVRRGDFGGAIEHYQSALRVEPGSAETHNNLGVAFAQGGRLPEAIAEFTEALRLNPAHVDARANLERARQGGE